jgi:hypothetical protein
LRNYQYVAVSDVPGRLFNQAADIVTGLNILVQFDWDYGYSQNTVS